MPLCARRQASWSGWAHVSKKFQFQSIAIGGSSSGRSRSKEWRRWLTVTSRVGILQEPMRPALADYFGAARLNQPITQALTAKFVLGVGEYLHERYHGRLYARAQNLRGVLREL